MGYFVAGCWLAVLGRIFFGLGFMDIQVIIAVGASGAWFAYKIEKWVRGAHHD